MDAGSSSFELEFKSIQTTENPAKRKHIREIEEFLRTAFQTVVKLVRLDVQSPQYVSDEDLRCVYKVVCRCTRINRHTPIDVVSVTRELVNKIAQWSEKLKGMTATVVISDKRMLFVPRQYQGSVDLYLGAKDLSFGNVIDHNKYIRHCKLDKDETLDHFGPLSTMVKYYEADPIVQPLIKHRIMVDFEHDRRRMFIRFPAKAGRVDKVEAVMKLELRYNTIKRILVQFDDEDSENPETTLFLHLDTVPIIYRVKFEEFAERGKPNKKIDPKRRLYSLGDRQKFWEDKRFDDYVESPFIKLVLHPAEAGRIMNILNRMVASTTKPILFRGIVDHPVYGDRKVFAQHFPDPQKDGSFLQTIKNDFAVRYMIEALTSRGYQVKDRLHLFVNYIRSFKEQITMLFAENKGLLLDSLEKLLAMVDESIELDPIPHMFEIAIKKSREGLNVSSHVNQEQALKGYVRLRKVVITPCRIIYQAPEMIMGNRVLRIMEDKYPAEKFLRVAFRDENLSRVQSAMGGRFIESFIKRSLMDKKIVGGKIFNYLGSSNSQMREQGCYFIQAEHDEEINAFRRSLGQFELKSVPKMMARLGQCFTQSCKVGKPMQRNSYDRTYDYLGINNRKKDPPEAFVYSDGNGYMSAAFAQQIAKSMNYQDFIPCCFQSRFRGFKGIHVVNPELDRLNDWAAENGIRTGKIKGEALGLDLLCRPSQEKFRTGTTQCFYEVVKISAPSPVCLNRPLINILDQVSAMQSYACHKQMVNRCFQLLDMQLNGIANSLTDEKWARTKLGEFPRLIMVDVLKNVNLTTEPFFRALLRTSARCTLKKLREKMQIQIPASMGRSLLGVVDETGQLQYGQVFVRYTVNIMQKRPGPGAAREVITGAVLITKNPMVVAGDVRMFEAVDIPSLHHLCDVVVFPRYGPRPHPDEMAGSDLDGDEYSVIWDPGLYLERNEPAFDYTAPPNNPDAVEESKLREQMADFFVKYVSQDSIGKIANAFLVKADQLGLNSKVCHSIAVKNMEAVDFPKTGKTPSPLAKADIARKIDSEKANRFPDFMEKTQESAYESPRLNGRLFRRIKAIDNELETTIDEQVNSPVQCDHFIYIDGYDDQRYLDIAKDHFRKYTAALEHQLLQRFGVETEVELFSNSYSAIRKRISDKEMDDMSFFNTQRVIEETLEQIYATHRRMFFEAFGQKFEDLTDSRIENENREVSDNRHVLRDQCSTPSDDLKKLAVAYYYTAYEAGHQRYLSFAWICADVTVRVRLDYITDLRRQDPLGDHRYYSFDPVSDRLSNHIDEYLNSKPARKTALTRHLQRSAKMYRLKNSTKVILRYCEVYDGLMDWLSFTVKWAEKNGILIGTEGNKERDLMEEQQVGVTVFNPTHICLMVILYGQGKLDTINTPRFLEEPDDLDGLLPVDLRKQNGGLGQKFLGLMRFMASRDFLMLSELSFLDLEYVSGFYNNEWFYAQKAAEKTYYKICLTNDYTSIPYDKDKQKVTDIVEKVDIEGRIASDGISFLVELLKGTCHQVMNKENVRALENHSGCESIFWRQDFANSDDCGTDRIYVTAVGTVTAVNRLRRYLTPKGYLNSRMTDLKMGKSFASQVMNKIYQLTRKEENETSFRDETEEPVTTPPPASQPKVRGYIDENGHIQLTGRTDASKV